MNICANFDILFYLSHPRNKYAEQTLFEINTMLYLAELLSIYDGCNAQKWGYGFARNKYGAPVSIELMEEVEFLCAKGYLSKDSSGYYRISDTASLNSILSISKSGILGWRSKYIEVVFDSLLTKSFPRVVRAVQNEPGISLLESINRTSTLLESSLINALYLTVFDGRRGKTSNQYERQEINYRSEYSSHPSMNYRRFYMAECV